MVVDTGDMVTGADATTEGVGDTGKVVKWWLPWLEALLRFLRYMLQVVVSRATSIGQPTVKTQDTSLDTPLGKECTAD